MDGRDLNFIFGLSSLLGLILTAVIAIFAMLAGDFGLQSNTLIASLAFINLALAVVCMSLFRRSDNLSQSNASLEPTITANKERIATLSTALTDKDSDFGEVVDICHSIQDQLRDRNFELHAATMSLLAGDGLSDSQLIDYERTNELFYLFLVNNIKAMFDLLTHDKCAVCVKLLKSTGEADSDILVSTFMRDASSYRERKSSDISCVEYPYYENTAFKEIFSLDSPNGHYASDDLSAERTYVNVNANWEKYYNATLVCPIRLELVHQDEQEWVDYSVLGFVCVDNLKGGLDNRVCIQLLAGISDSLYNHYSLLDELQNAANATKKESVVDGGSGTS